MATIINGGTGGANISLPFWPSTGTFTDNTTNGLGSILLQHALQPALLPEVIAGVAVSPDDAPKQREGGTVATIEGTPVKAALNDEQRARYKKAADTVGWKSPSLADEELLEFFVQQGWKEYDEGAVARYMNGVVERLSVKGGTRYTWWWVGLRREDCPAGQISAGAQRAYDLPIPERVMEKAAALAERFGPANLDFVITQVRQVPKADPFMAVRMKGGKRWVVFEVWDEPGFTG